MARQLPHTLWALLSVPVFMLCIETWRDVRPSLTEICIQSICGCLTFLWISERCQLTCVMTSSWSISEVYGPVSSLPSYQNTVVPVPGHSGLAVCKSDHYVSSWTSAGLPSTVNNWLCMQCGPERWDVQRIFGRRLLWPLYWLPRRPSHSTKCSCFFTLNESLLTLPASPATKLWQWYTFLAIGPVLVVFAAVFWSLPWNLSIHRFWSIR